mmetsp:Transcript_754/g.1984  ORF Transcript_754/g.1984 Transcript_754/m.1984 type:complete len:348 (+) Transcript_754:114-1157(+)
MPAVAGALAMPLLLQGAPGAGLCMELREGRPFGGVRAATCDGSVEQQWSLASHGAPGAVSIAPVASPDYCLAAASASSGGELYVGDCGDAPWPAVLWEVEEGSYEIRASGQDGCVGAGDESVGSPLAVWNCSDPSQHSWGYDAGRKAIYLSVARRLQGGLGSAVAEPTPEGSSGSLRGSPPAEQAGATASRESLAGALRGSRSGGVTCDGQGGKLEGAAGSFCCGDPGEQIACAPGSACGEGQDGLPICQVPGGIACQGVAGELRGAAGSQCCGASSYQIVCGPGSHCAGSDEVPICGGPVTCAGRLGIPVTAAAGSICCGDEGYQIACGPGARCGGLPTLPICLAR